MRVLSFALALFAADMVVEAGVCKPAHTTTVATSIVESSTATASAASETSFTESLTSATETLSTDSSEILTASTTEAETTSTEAVSTTTEEASTTTTAGPSYTPGSLVGTGPVAGLTLHGTDSRFIPLSFTPSDSTQTLIFTLAANGQLATGNNNNYLCLNYKPSGVLGPLVLCPFDDFTNAPLKCTRAASGTLSCTAPNGSCEASGTCRRSNNAAAFSQLYVDGSQNGYFGPSDGNFGADYTAIDVILAE
ncbi:hypothetical protein AU210_002322 [Fusarium oxysporum f. sp. radicis-cucumerinum]|uniref:Uncharacterized protein n=3 Tax=Fusarium oxysporum TaxID=5507 RepID=A0A2H3HKS9_FUSOX|nr:hypothetical protein AU210_002322 [Fusarium oxysporum f. sp. radicis-cucumerinum]RKK18210.1 hypothetical protein BFJ65_g8524 [Fusarium oxysporum f. sp. cepae]RKK49705.1 hypothetical protein BFJ67_g6727 [Fusarium oxysporum f. sp. cepae]RKK51822.1 hypothetical protein BFJ66_g5928 [Fusarium oxysporum f. sp. cepae]RKL08816.1 hypothetical protein BFJ68_g9306 [Fusarium oxysporum]